MGLGLWHWDRALFSQVLVGAPLIDVGEVQIWPKLEQQTAAAPLEVVVAGLGSAWVADEDATSHWWTAAEAATSHYQTVAVQA